MTARVEAFVASVALFCRRLNLLDAVFRHHRRKAGAYAVNAIAFDTHAFAKRLVGVGMPEPQAEVLADEPRRRIDDRLATKDDLARLEAATKTEIVKLEGSLKRDISETKADIVKWVVGTIGFQAVVVLGAGLSLGRLGH